MPKSSEKPTLRFLLLACIAALALGLSSPALPGDGRVIATPEGGELEFNVHFRFPPTVAHLDELEDWIERGSVILCDATDGVLRIGSTRLSTGGLSEGAADFWYYFGGAGRGHSSLAPIHEPNRRFYLSRNSSQGGAVIAHELGHLLLGLGDQYDEQRRFGRACGIGPSFDAGAMDERNHTLMQAGLQGPEACTPTGAGVPSGATCYRDADCPAGEVCPLPPLSTELSVAANFDLLRGDNVICPANRAGNELVIDGDLGGSDDAGSAFDGTDFDTALASAEAATTEEFVDDLGDLQDGRFERSSHLLMVYADFLGGEDWRLHIGVDAGDIDNLAPEDEPSGGEDDEGDLQIIAIVDLTFASSGASRAIVEVNGVAVSDPGFTAPVIEIEDLESGASDGALTLDVSALRMLPGDVSSDLSGTNVLTDGEQQLGICSQSSCQQNWQTTTERWEASAVTVSAREGGGTALSDWESLSANLPGLYSIAVAAPGGLPQMNPPAHCLTPVAFERALDGVDKLFLVIDRSGSMETTREVIGESRTRLEWAQSGARAFADLAAGAGIEVGLISFESVATRDLALRVVMPDSAGAAPTHWTAAELKAAIDGLAPDGGTAIGDALDLALDEMEGPGLVGARGRAIYLLSDGQNNAGVNDPDDVADDIRDAGIQVFSLPLGNEADGEVLAEIAATTQGGMIDVNSEFELPPVYAELYASFRGESPVLARTRSAVRGAFVPVPILRGRIDDEAPAPRRSAANAPLASDELPPEESFQIRVVPGAERLNVLLSARADAVSAWGPGFRLEGPGGEVVTNGNPAVIEDAFYRLIRVPNPSPGLWTLTMFALGPSDQLSYVLAHEENAMPECYPTAAPVIQGDVAAGVRLSALASFGRPLGIGVDYVARVTRPDGSVVTLDLPLNDEVLGGDAVFTQFVGRGIYRVRVECRVGDRARFTPGERSTNESVAAQGRPPVFTRFADTSFYLDVTDLPPLPPGDDCDGDGISNAEEGTADTDGDGVVDACDGDADGDDVPDRDEPAGDADGDGIPNGQDPDSDNDGVIDGEDDDPYTVARFEYRYAAKLVCGASNGKQPGSLARGRYYTTINVTNLGRNRVSFEKLLSLAIPPGSQKPGEVLPVSEDVLAPYQSLAVDCEDLQRRLFPNGLPAPLIDGTVILRSPQPLEVTAVYSQNDREVVNEPGSAGDGPRPCGCCGCGCGHGCGPQVGQRGGHGRATGVGIGSSFDVERVPGRRIEVPPPVVRRLPNLVPQRSLPPTPAELPEGLPGFDFCERNPKGGVSRVLSLRAANIGNATARQTVTRIVFGNDGGTTEMPTPALAPSETHSLSAKIPRQCYGAGSSPCRFTITVDAAGSSTESNEADNVTAGLCLQPEG